MPNRPAHVIETEINTLVDQMLLAEKDSTISLETITAQGDKLMALEDELKIAKGGQLVNQSSTRAQSSTPTTGPIEINSPFPFKRFVLASLAVIGIIAAIAVPAINSSSDTNSDDRGNNTASVELVKEVSAELDAIAKTIAPNDLIRVTPVTDYCLGRNDQVYCTEDYMPATVNLTETTADGLSQYDKISAIMKQSSGWSQQSFEIYDSEYRPLERSAITDTSNYSLDTTYLYTKDSKNYCLKLAYEKDISDSRFDLGWRGTLLTCDSIQF